MNPTEPREITPVDTRTACRCGWRSEWHAVGDGPNALWFARRDARVEYAEHWDREHDVRPAPTLEER